MINNRQDYCNRHVIQGLCRKCCEPLFSEYHCFLHEFYDTLRYAGLVSGVLSPEKKRTRTRIATWMQGRYDAVRRGQTVAVTREEALVASEEFRRRINNRWGGVRGVLKLAKILYKLEQKAKKRRA